jgi:hypothetical protein
MKSKTWIWVAVVVIVVIGLFVWGRSASETSAGTWADTDVACLPGGHQNAMLHIHPEIEIMVDGIPETVPANIGINQFCMAEVHTHAADGVIHLESVNTSAEFPIADFFTVWDRELERESYDVSVTVNGEEVSDPLSYIMGDHDLIVITYTSTGSGESSATE